MALDANSAKALIAKRGVSPPAGVYPGTPEYDQWAVDWLFNAVNAGDPEAIMATGQYQSTATDQTTGSTPQGVTWTGSVEGRETFPQMIRRIAREQGWSEDFARFSDAQISAWEPLWDPQAQRFRSENDPDGAAIYDKPAECPEGTTFHGSKCVPWSQLPYELGGTATSAPVAAATATPAAAPQEFGLQQALEQQFMGRGGLFADTLGAGLADIYGKSLSGGGLWWGQDQNMFDNTPYMTASRQTSSPMTSPGGVTSSAALLSTPAGGALEQALLKKYQPQLGLNNWWRL